MEVLQGVQALLNLAGNHLLQPMDCADLLLDLLQLAVLEDVTRQNTSHHCCTICSKISHLLLEPCSTDFAGLGGRMDSKLDQHHLPIASGNGRGSERLPACEAEKWR